MNKGNLIFLTPIILVAAAISVYFVLIPKIYGDAVPFADWFLSDSAKIINSMHGGGKSLPSVGGIVALEIFWRVWFVLFVTSLFFVGKRLHNPEKKFSEDAVMIKNDPYLAVQDALDRLQRNDISDELDEVIDSVKKLSDKLYYESDFGLGDSNVTDCENEIAKLLKSLVSSAKNLKDGNFEENLKNLKALIDSVNSLLNVRANLEKRR